jgi:hypothetical protein
MHKQVCYEGALLGRAEPEELSLPVRLKGAEYTEVNAPEAGRRRAFNVALSVH